MRLINTRLYLQNKLNVSTDGNFEISCLGNVEILWYAPIFYKGTVNFILYGEQILSSWVSNTTVDTKIVDTTYALKTIVAERPITDKAQ